MDDDVVLREITRLSPRLRAWSRRETTTGADADDLYQEVVIRVWENRAQCRAEETFEGWLFTIARTTLIDRQRSARRTRLPQEPEAGALADLIPDEAAEEPVQIDDVRHIVSDIILQMTAAGGSTALRLAEFLRAWQETAFDLEETAKSLNWEPGSVRAELWKVLDWCRKNGVSRADYVVLLLGVGVLGLATCPARAAANEVDSVPVFCRELLSRIRAMLPVLAAKYAGNIAPEPGAALMTREEIAAAIDRAFEGKGETDDEYPRPARVRDTLMFWFRYLAETMKQDDRDYANRKKVQAGLLAFMDCVFWINLYPDSSYELFTTAWAAFRTAPAPEKATVVTECAATEKQIIDLFDEYVRSLRP